MPRWGQYERARDQNMLTMDVQYGGSPVKVGEDEYHLFRDSEILAKINE